PSAGAVYYRGQDIWKMDKKQFMQFRMKAQMIYQDPYSSLNPRKKVYDILAIPIRVHKLVGQEQEQAVVYSALEDVGLSPAATFAEKYPFELSGGQRQRVAIARAMVLRPEIVVADEPITMLDASLRLGVLDTMLSLQKRMNLSLLFITHDLGMAYYIAGTTGKIAVIYLGSLVEYGPASEVLK
ncbi:MAG: ATP-binding cassette domain-containing protein, partial [Thermoprotei archaeon]